MNKIILILITLFCCTFTVDAQEAPNWYPQYLEGAGDTDAGEQ